MKKLRNKKKRRNKNKIDEKEFWVNKYSFRYKHPIFLVAVQAILLVAGIVGIIWFALNSKSVFSYDELKISETDLIIKFENSKVYDKNGNYLATLSSGTKRECISLEEMSEYLPLAYIAIEDERFYEHFGVDLKRTVAATGSFLINFGKSDFGGSTITQQVVKNITQDKEDSANRKIKEMAKAIQVEHYLDKKQILSLYLNIIFVGGNDINGVQLGSKYYFNKSAKELTIAECAFLAGINHAPNGYKPFVENNPDMQEKIKHRTKTVLGKMLELNYISQEQFDEANGIVDAGLPFNKGNTQPTTVISYQTEAALDQIIKQIMAEKGVNRTMAETMLYSGGYNIYTTQDTGIQEKVENELRNQSYVRTNKDQTSMATVAVIENNSGYVVACGAGMNEEKIKTNIGNFNYPVSLKKQTGSCMKPISVLAPGLENNVLTGATVFYDGDTYFGKYHPKNYYYGYKGPMTLRRAMALSANIPHVKGLVKVGVDNSKNFCASVGITDLSDEGLALALGGLKNGASVTQMASAYQAIANNGTYIEPTFYTEVKDSDGNVFIKSKSVEERSKNVMSVQNAYIEKNILQDVVLRGTATYCGVPGMDVAAKTGTTNNDNDRWLCGFTEYYSTACWYGYEKNATVYYDGNPAGIIWSAIMRKIHEGLPGRGFDQPEGIVRVNVCGVTGHVASGSCSQVYSEVFREGAVPSGCDGHTAVNICNDTGLLATANCKNVSTVFLPKVLEQEQNAGWTTIGYGANNTPRTYCQDTHAAPEPVPAAPAVDVAPSEPAPQPDPTPTPSQDAAGTVNNTNPATP